MKVNYFPDTDSLYIDLSERPSAESREMSDGVVLDYDHDGNLVGIDIDNASLRTLIKIKLPTSSREQRIVPFAMEAIWDQREGVHL